eukprot:Partr_v1_DN27597_c0_g1_i1_m30353
MTVDFSESTATNLSSGKKRCRVLFFAFASECTGKPMITVDWPRDDGDRQPTIADLIHHLILIYPSLKAILSTSVISVNLEIIDDMDARLSHGDEVAIIPPVSGG